MKSYGVTIQMKPLCQFFSDMVLFVFGSILQKEIWKFCPNLTFATFGSERVKSLKHIRLTCR